ncbi:hypothetical protein PanWU01x14_336260, partial [Parasponia andersonii]
KDGDSIITESVCYNTSVAEGDVATKFVKSDDVINEVNLDGDESEPNEDSI